MPRVKGIGGIIFKAKEPELMQQWYAKHQKDFDFKRFGLPSWYPTRTLEKWQAARDQWEPWVFRSPGSMMTRPKIGG